jgi:molybdopterin-guanine dinucleotide biosynthesis protein A
MRSAAILAGGLATRFGGRDKSALVVDGRSILDRQLDVLTAVADDVLIVAGPQNAATVAAARRARVRVITDAVPGCGPLGGIHAALTEAAGDPVFVLACDMPFVNARFVAHLFALAADADIVVPETDRGYHPLCAVYSRRCLESIAAHLATGRLAVRELIGAVPTRVVAAEEIARFDAPPRLLANVNTPAELQGLEALQSHKL